MLFVSQPIVLFQREDLHGIRLQTFNYSMTLQYRIHILCWHWTGKQSCDEAPASCHAGHVTLRDMT